MVPAMGFWFEFDPRNKILLGRFAGRLTDQSLAEFYSAVRKYSRATDARAGIFDLSHVTEVAICTEHARNLAHQEPAMPDTSRRPSILVAPTLLGQGLARIFQIAGASTRPLLQIAKTMDEAFASLGVESPHFEPLE
jgi:hypothetical protein